MATRWHKHSIVLGFLAVLLVFPPLTSVVADGLGIDLAHHHCESHDDDPDHQESAKADPYQCDQCHVATVAMVMDADILVRSDQLAPDARPAVQLLPVRAPPVFRPPIA